MVASAHTRPVRAAQCTSADEGEKAFSGVYANDPEAYAMRNFVKFRAMIPKIGQTGLL
jgi:hypothetical protein